MLPSPIATCHSNTYLYMCVCVCASAMRLNSLNAMRSPFFSLECNATLLLNRPERSTRAIVVIIIVAPLYVTTLLSSYHSYPGPLQYSQIRLFLNIIYCVYLLYYKVLASRTRRFGFIQLNLYTHTIVELVYENGCCCSGSFE